MSRSKREIDKELMYKKLMPSGSSAIRAAEEERTPAPKAPPAAPFPAAVQQEDAFHRPPVPRRVSIPALDNHPMVVVNTMESLVLQKLESVLERFSCCRCDRCKKDIVALALNKLPPKYRVMAEGQAVPDADPQTNAQIVSAMIQAVIKVRANPRH
jgi:hypothetical protein